MVKESYRKTIFLTIIEQILKTVQKFRCFVRGTKKNCVICKICSIIVFNRILKVFIISENLEKF